MLRLSAILSFFIITTSVFAQQYYLNGSASALGGDCYIVCPDVLSSKGTVWYSNQLDLSKSFDIECIMNFGSRNDNMGPQGSYDTGADGIAFVLQQVGTSALGGVGIGIGYTGLSPSLDIEFDTWQNTGTCYDPVYDHVAIIRDGNCDHTSPNNLAGPVQSNVTKPDIEDSLFYNVRITWNPATDSMKVYFDCKLRLKLKYDITNNIFSGNPIVWWGFTSATGGARNLHIVCLDTAMALGVLEDTTICKGDTIQLDVSSNSTNCSWSPNYGISDTSVYNPLFYPDTTTKYYVAYVDECGNKRLDSIMVFVIPAIDASFTMDTLICTDEKTTITYTGNAQSTAIYNWTFNGASAIVGSGQGPYQVTWQTAGKYDVKLTVKDAQCTATYILQITVFPKPNIGFSVDKYNGCAPLTVNFTDNSTPANIQSYHWDFGDPTSGSKNTSTLKNPSHTFNNSGQYTITLIVTTTDGCSDTLTISNLITVYITPVASFEPLPSIATTKNPTIQFINNSSYGLSWFWNFGNPASGSDNTSTLESPSHTYVGNGVFEACLVVVSVDSCIDSTCRKVRIIEDQLTFPNVFTPNGDGVNETFEIKNLEQYLSNHLVIYNRWGKKVYEVNDYKNDWDGGDCSDGVYYYILHYKGFLEDGEETGTITIIK